MQVVALKPEHWEAFRQIRIHALKSEPSLLSGDWQQLAQNPDSYWINMLSDKAVQVFGLTNENKVVGIAAVFPYWEDKTGTVGYLGWNYVLPKFRKQGGGALLAQARINWAKQGDQYESLLFFCRQTNKPIQALYQKLGFEFSHSFESHFPDGSEDLEFVYKLHLKGYESGDNQA